jgi:hypothetical protein
MVPLLLFLGCIRFRSTVKDWAESRRERSNDYRSSINRHAVVGTLAYPDWPVISHTSWNTLPSYGSPGAVGRNPVVDRKITSRIEEVRELGLALLKL